MSMWNVWIVWTALWGQESGKDVIKKVQERYKKIKTLEVSFDYQFKWKLTGKLQNLTGKLFYKKENYIRYELGQQLNITDGQTVWQYSEGINQVIVDRLKKGSKSLFLPKYFLYEYMDKFVAEIIKTEAIKGRSVYVLKMNPKDKDDFVQSMKIWVPSDTWLTERVEYTDLEGNVISYSFTQVVTDPVLDDKLFTFSPEAGTDVIDLR